MAIYLMQQRNYRSATLVERFETLLTAIEYAIMYWPEDRTNALIVYEDEKLVATITPVDNGCLVMNAKLRTIYHCTDIDYVYKEGRIVATNWCIDGKFYSKLIG